MKEISFTLRFQVYVKLTIKSLVEYLGNDKVKQLVNWALKYIAELEIPVKRGTFVEFRTGMINISPIGRNCTQSEREEFHKYDLVGRSDFNK
jgi:phosphomannomutase